MTQPFGHWNALAAVELGASGCVHYKKPYQAEEL
jgi:hypothetical protein